MRDVTCEVSRWVDEYTLPLMNRAIVMLPNKDDASDIVQEVFYSAYTNYHKYERKSAPLTWLYSILRYKVADYYRAKYKNLEDDIENTFFNSVGGWSDDSVLNEWELEEDAEPKINDVIDNCVDKLPPQWCLAVKLYYLEEKKTNDVCDKLSITNNNLWKILQRSRLQLRKCLEINWFSE